MVPCCQQQAFRRRGRDAWGRYVIFVASWNPRALQSLESKDSTEASKGWLGELHVHDQQSFLLLFLPPTKCNVLELQES